MKNLRPVFAALCFLLAACVSPVFAGDETAETDASGAGADASDPGAADKADENPKAAPNLQDTLVIIENNESAGSGFIATIKGRSFLVTNIHVLGAAKGAVFSNLVGDKIPVGTVAFLSPNRDLAIVPVQWDGPALEVAASLKSEGVKIGDEITVRGNSLGGGVATDLSGKVTGLGPEEIEVDAKFVQGNSGSPVIHDASGKVVGIAAYLKDVDKGSKWTKDTELSDIRRFAYRMDGEIQWQQVSFEKLFSEYEVFSDYEDRTIALAALTYTMIEDDKLITGLQNHPSIGHLVEDVMDGFDWSRGFSSASNRQKVDKFVLGIRNELQRDSGVKKKLTIDFYRDQIDLYTEYREGVEKSLKRYSAR